MSEQIERISAMERAMNEAAEAVEALDAALARYEALLPELRALEEYYEGPLWRRDFNDDSAGRLPADLPRGVLTEDALYDLLCDNDALVQKLRRVSKKTNRRGEK